MKNEATYILHSDIIILNNIWRVGDVLADGAEYQQDYYFKINNERFSFSTQIEAIKERIKLLQIMGINKR